MQEITHGALFSGSGGFELAARMCGISSIWASEIEPFPIKVTKARFPDMEHIGDIGMVDGAKIPPVDIISGGSPCQDMSIAGRRQGLKGERSVLFMDYIRIVKEMRKKHGKPRFMVWENVPGAFSSNKGEDFRCVLEEIAGIAEPGVSIPQPPKGKWRRAGEIVGDGYSIAWRVLDAQYWGIGKDGSEESFDDFIHLHTKPELSDEIIQLTGITDLQLATEGIPEEDAVRKFIRMMEPWDAFVNGNTLLVAHNAQFDLMFVCYAILRHKKKNSGWLRVFNDADYLDTLTVYRDRHKYPHRLENAIEQYGLGAKVENSHRAIDDCRALFEVAKAMEAEKDDLAGYINIFGYPAKYGVSGRKLKKVTYLEQGFSNYSGRTLPEQLSRK